MELGGVYRKMTIKELRQLTGLNIKQFCELLHIPRRTYDNWEKGISNPPEYLVYLLIYYLKNENLIKESSC